jgi:regulator of protease activity HflC (stomatin/prohibitin superfamily)
MQSISSIMVITVGIAVFWWILWCILAAVKKDIGLMLFLIVLGTAWALLEAYLIAAESYGVFPLLIVPVIVLAPMLRIITEYERGVLFRLGRQKLILGAGMNLIFPLGIDLVRKVDLRTFTIDVPKQEVITKDNVPMLVDAVVYFNVFDPSLAVIKVANYVSSTSLLGQTILRSILGQHELDEILSKRTELNNILREQLDAPTDPWGIKVTAVEMKAIELPDSMKRAMAKQAEAERERRAKVIMADGEFQASEKLAQAAQVIGMQPAAIQLRYLQTLTEISVEKNSTVVFPLPMEILRYFDALTKAAEQRKA